MRLQIEEGEADFDPDFLRHTFPKLDWAALKGAAETLGDQSLLSDVYHFNKQHCQPLISK